MLSPKGTIAAVRITFKIIIQIVEEVMEVVQR